MLNLGFDWSKASHRNQRLRAFEVIIVEKVKICLVAAKNFFM